MDTDGDTLSLRRPRPTAPRGRAGSISTGQYFTGTPGNADVGTPIQVRLTATDADGDTVTTDFTINVTNVNDAPVLTQADREPARDGRMIVLAATGRPVSSSIRTTDCPAVPAQTVTLTATLGDGSALPSWLIFNPASRTFSGTPGNANQGALDIVVTASDWEAASTATHFGIFVGNTGNTAPTVGTAIGTQTATEDTPFSFQVPVNAFADTTPGDHLRYTATLSNGAALPGWLSFDPVTGVFSGTPANANVAQSTIKVTATDIFGASVSANFILNVSNVNDAPTANGMLDSFAVTAQNAPFSYVIPSNFSSPISTPAMG